MVEVRIRNYEEGQVRLDPPARVGDLVHKCSFMYALILPNTGRLMLWHLRVRWFRAIAYFDDHDAYAHFLNIFFTNSL